MKTSKVCVLLAFAVFGVKCDIKNLYGQVESCVKELSLNLEDYSELVDKADDDGVISSVELEQFKVLPGGPCLLKCVLVHRKYFKENGDLITVKNDKIDMSSCLTIKSDDICEQVSKMSICIVKLMEATSG